MNSIWRVKVPLEWNLQLGKFYLQQLMQSLYVKMGFKASGRGIKQDQLIHSMLSIPKPFTKRQIFGRDQIESICRRQIKCR